MRIIRRLDRTPIAGGDIEAANKLTRKAFPLTCRAYDLYWAADTPAMESHARLLVSLARHVEGLPATDPMTGELS